MLELHDGGISSCESSDDQELYGLDIQPSTTGRITSRLSENHTHRFGLGVKSRMQITVLYILGLCVAILCWWGIYLGWKRPTTQICPTGTRRDYRRRAYSRGIDDIERTSASPLLLDQGLKLFVRGRGLMTRHQLRIMRGQARRPIQEPALRAADLGLNQRILRSTAATQAGQSEQAGGQAAAVPLADQNLGYYYSDILPVRCVASTTMMSERESEPLPYSPQYQILAGRLNDPAQTGVLSSVVRGPNVRDATTMSSLVKAMALRPSTRFEISAMLRSGCMSLSMAEENYETDPIPYRFVRKAKNVEYGGMSIQQKPNVIPDDWKIIAMPLDTFVALANNSYFATTPLDFSYSELDVTWTVTLRQRAESQIWHPCHYPQQPEIILIF